MKRMSRMTRVTLSLDEHAARILLDRAAAVGSKSKAARELLNEAAGNAFRLRVALRAPLNQIIHHCGDILSSVSLGDARMVALKIQQSADDATAIVARQTTA